jgi:hypothetical protein
MAPVPTLERPEPQSAREDDDSLIELTDPQEIELDAGRMSFLEHLDELRKRLIASITSTNCAGASSGRWRPFWSGSPSPASSISSCSTS